MLRNLDARYQPTLRCAKMKDIVILLAHLLTTVAKFLSPGGTKAVIAPYRQAAQRQRDDGR
mgnify:CR=1 FL=1